MFPRAGDRSALEVGELVDSKQEATHLIVVRELGHRARGVADSLQETHSICPGVSSVARKVRVS